MKKWLFLALLAALLWASVGCDKTQIPNIELPDTVDELTVITTAEETAAPTEPAQSGCGSTVGFAAVALLTAAAAFMVKKKD